MSTHSDDMLDTMVPVAAAILKGIFIVKIDSKVEKSTNVSDPQAKHRSAKKSQAQKLTLSDLKAYSSPHTLKYGCRQ
jgi:hypothetical protein